jgi:peptidoglycan-associated lipoprotein
MMRRSLLLLCNVVWLCACSTTAPPAVAPVAHNAAPVAEKASVAPAAHAQASAVSAPAAESPWQIFRREQSTLDSRSVFFDYDRFAIRADAYPVIEQHASLPIEFPKDHLVLQGNCDERGGREYNLALGQKRADAVRERLAILGVPSARVETVSYGKEKPRDSCHDEQCWSVNRRVDFVDNWK